MDRVWLLLDELQRWTEEIEPLKTPQRFGNLAFRSWGDCLETRVTALHEALLPTSLHAFIPELQTYLLGSFGSWQRLDYGSGHELSFAAWLCFLERLGLLGDRPSESEKQPVAPLAHEEKLALDIFPKYLEVVWGIQDRYGLEPAGSHGVWGLDDYHFIPYALGAAQLRSQTEYQPIAVISPSHKPERRQPRDILQFVPASSTIPSAARPGFDLPGPPFANLFTSSIARIHSLKRGPFHEHSPILHDVASTVPNWVKVHAGMMKMWTAECLDKRPVVQHFPFGGVAFPWSGPNSAADDAGHANVSASHSQLHHARLPMAPTGAPWLNQGQQRGHR